MKTKILIFPKFRTLFFLFLFISVLYSNTIYAGSLVLSSTTYENKVVVEHYDGYNPSFWIAGGWMRVDWYVNGIYYNSDSKYGMTVSDRTIVVNNKSIDCSNYSPGATITITAKTYYHDAFTFSNWGPDLTAAQTLKAYTNVSNVTATDGVYMTKIDVKWDNNEMFSDHSYKVQNNSQSITSNLPQGTNMYTHSGLQPGFTGNYRVISYINNIIQTSSSNQGSTFNPDMQASSNLGNSISVKWNNTGNTYQADGFYLDWYNDITDTWDLLWERDDNIYHSKIDNGSVHQLIPGYTYQYRLRVKPLGVSDVVATTSGMVKPNGQISGYVRTPLPNQVPVLGVMVKAVLVGDALPTDTTTTYTAYTNSEGYYEIDNIFYNEEADFVVTPIYDDRIFNPVNTTVTLNMGNNNAEANFDDMSSFVISGNIMLESCPIEGVKIIIDNDTTDVLTDENGEYTITVSSGGTYTITPLFGEHLFSPNQISVDVSANVSDVNFTDTTRYLVEGYLTASCNAFIGVGDIHFYSIDDSYCFEQTVTVDATGYYSIYLPASKYRVNVPNFTSIDENIVNSVDVMAYFAIPRILDITSYNNELFHGDSTNFDLTYRLKPTLSMGGLSYINSCDDDTIPLVRQYEPAIIEFSANEEFNGNICPASDGYIIIRENVSSIGMGENIDTLYYETGQTIEYEITPGTPNIIADQAFKKYFKAILVRDNQTDTLYTDVVVLGNLPREQDFTTVTPQIPFHIIHNPPGDASYSFFQESQSLYSEYSYSFLQEGSIDTYVRVQAGSSISVGVAIGLDASIDLEQQFDVTGSLGVGSSGLTDWASSITTTMTQEYQTSGNVNITGEAGDVYIGGAMSMLYGVTDILEYDFDECEYLPSQSLFMQPEGIETTFMYTESHITDVVIPELQSITDYYNSINEVDSANYFANQLGVWQQFVQHNHETIENAPEIETISFSGGVGYTNSVDTSNSSSKSFDFNIYVEYGVAVDAGIAVAGAGVFGGVAIMGRSTYGSVLASNTTTSTTTGYYLGDDDEYDDYVVQVGVDKIYGVPTFKLISGQSSCPWEEGTVPREGVQLSTGNTYQNVEETDAAVFILHLANTSQTDEEITYDLIFDHTTNPGGASITIGGSPIVGDVPYPYTIPAWSSVDVTITVERGPTEFDYNGLKFILKSQCDEQIQDNVYLNVHFYKEYDLTVAVNGQGTTNLSTGVFPYEEEHIVNLYASANNGYVFEKWIVGNDTYYTQAIPVTMDMDKTATAYFIESTEPQYEVNISHIGNGASTPPAGSYYYNAGTDLELIANPELYNAFVKWTVNGEVLTDAIINLVINENTEIVAEFIKTYQLNITSSGNGTTNPELGCHTYIKDTIVGVFASPNEGYVFEKWVIDSVNVFDQYVEIEMNKDVSAMAYFISTQEEQHTLYVSSSTEGGATTPPTGEYFYVDGSNIEITAIPESGYLFDKWIINSIETTTNPVNLTLTGDFTAEAYFKTNPLSIEKEIFNNICNVFPNPSNGIIQVNSSFPIKEIRIMDITGKVTDIFDGSNVNTQNIILANYNSGIYLISIVTKKSNTILKLEIHK